MPVMKYRSVEEIPRPKRCENVDAVFLERLAKLWRRSALLRPPRDLPKGVLKFRTIEEAQRARAGWARR